MEAKKQARQQLIDMISADFEISRGHPLPFGATVARDGINFSIMSGSATKMNLVIFDKCSNEPLVEFPLDPRTNKTGNIWHAHIAGLDPWLNYAWRVYGDDYMRLNGVLLIDPYARATCGGEKWSEPQETEHNKREQTLRLSNIVDDYFDWELDRPLNTPLRDTIIYELHVRGFSKHASSGVKAPGTFLGIIEKIPYLQALGITAVELMPITDFDETDVERVNPVTGERLKNYWGYDPISFFALKNAYSASPTPDGAVNEFRKMVKALHKAGIEIILDMVYNHTAEGNEQGRFYSLKGFDRDVYYLYDTERRHYHNYSGCGNTVNCNHPVVRSMILDSLRYWVTEMHVDGFRFDLASILSRGPNGEVLSNPPVLERISLDPVLANTKIIAEAWDAAGLYQVGSFGRWQRWMEWNGRYRDDVRRFIRGDNDMLAPLARRLSGSADLYEDDGREPFHSVNFVSCHDGFPLADLVTYNDKHNIANGERNRDGENNNNSWNHGVEGPTTDVGINTLRRRQIKNYIALLMLSQGVPMFLAGDEFGRTQGGNNNAYCQDNAISWLDWDLLKTNKDLWNFFRELIRFRKENAALRRTRFKVDTHNGIPEMTWHGTRLNHPDWSPASRCIGLHLAPTQKGERDIYLIVNGAPNSQVFELPHPTGNGQWHQLLYTAAPAGKDIFSTEQAPLLKENKQISLENRSVMVLVGY